jgi:hypothetical protein
MDDHTQKDVIRLFDDGLLPQAIAEALGITLQDVVDALKRRLRLVDGKVQPDAVREAQMQRDMDLINRRLRVVEGASGGGDEAILPGANPSFDEAPIASADAFLSSTPASDDEWEEPSAADAAKPVAQNDVAGAVRGLLGHYLGQLEPGLAALSPIVSTGDGLSLLTARDRTGQTVSVGYIEADADDRAVTGLLAEMGRSANGRPVRGILVAGGFNERLRLAAMAVPGLDLKVYAFSLSFRDP